MIPFDDCFEVVYDPTIAPSNWLLRRGGGKAQFSVKTYLIAVGSRCLSKQNAALADVEAFYLAEYEHGWNLGIFCSVGSGTTQQVRSNHTDRDVGERVADLMGRAKPAIEASVLSTATAKAAIEESVKAVKEAVPPPSWRAPRVPRCYNCGGKGCGESPCFFPATAGPLPADMTYENWSEIQRSNLRFKDSFRDQLTKAFEGSAKAICDFIASKEPHG